MSGSPAHVVDRAAAVRGALVRLVARQGFHGASMSAIAKEAGVATGTAYVHYPSKDELVVASYVEVKQELGAAAAADVAPTDPPEERFRRLWFGMHEHLRADPDRARFLQQVDTSPYADEAHARSLATEEDQLLAAASAPDIAEMLAPLPLVVLYDLGFGPVVRLVASELQLDRDDLEQLCRACWRAIVAQ